MNIEFELQNKSRNARGFMTDKARVMVEAYDSETDFSAVRYFDVKYDALKFATDWINYVPLRFPKFY